jgi:hypothetical protein
VAPFPLALVKRPSLLSGAMSRGTDSAQLAYEAPRVLDYGSLTDLTAGQIDGNFLDADFPEGTPKSELTFSN